MEESWLYRCERSRSERGESSRSRVIAERVEERVWIWEVREVISWDEEVSWRSRTSESWGMEGLGTGKGRGRRRSGRRGRAAPALSDG